MRFRLFTLLLSAFLLAAAADKKPAAPGTPASPLTLLQTIPLPGVEGRFGLPAADPAGQRLFVPVAVSDSVEVISLKTGQRLQSIKGVRRPVAAAYHARTNRLYVSAREDNAVHILDAATYKEIRRVPVQGGDPDCVRIIPPGDLIGVSYGSGGILLLDPEGRPKGEIRMDVHPDEFVAGSRMPWLWTNVVLNKAVIVADYTSRRVTRTWPLTTASESGSNRSLAVDEKNERVFVVTRRPARVLVLNAVSGLRVDQRPTINDPESISYDAAARRLYITGDDPIIDVIGQTTPDRYEAVARVPSAPGARVSLFIPELSRLCVLAAGGQGRGAAVLVYTTGK